MKNYLILYCVLLTFSLAAQQTTIPYGNNSNAGSYASVNGIRIYYEEYGKGSPLLLLHGNWQSIRDFGLQIPELSKHYRVIAVDTRAHGKSTEDGKKFSYDLFAEDMNAFLDSLHLDSVNVLGWSDGGNTGLIMAMRYPSKVKKLVTMGSNIFMDTTVVLPFVTEQIYVLRKEFSEMETERSKVRIRLLDMLLTEPKYKFTDLGKIKIPVMVMAGENDLIREEHTKAIASGITKGKLLIASGESHDFPTENTSRFNALVLDFLAGQ